jgi:hypothetical protein
MENHMENTIELNTALAEQIGFLPGKFGRLSFLKKQGNNIVLSMVIPLQENALVDLVNGIKSSGFKPCFLDRQTDQLVEV